MIENDFVMVPVDLGDTKNTAPLPPVS